jgi:hypothetical protein
MTMAADDRPNGGWLVGQRARAVGLLITLGTTLALFLIPEDRKERILLGGVVVCAAVLIVTSRPVVRRLPTIALDRGGRGDGFSLQFRPPAIAGRKRIKVETQRLVTQIHATSRVDATLVGFARRTSADGHGDVGRDIGAGQASHLERIHTGGD